MTSFVGKKKQRFHMFLLMVVLPWKAQNLTVIVKVYIYIYIAMYYIRILLYTYSAYFPVHMEEYAFQYKHL